MKNVFISIPWFAPAYKAGGPVQSVLNMVNASMSGVRFHIFCGDADLDGKRLDSVQYDRWVRFNDRCSVYYATSSGRFGKLRRCISDVNPDIIYVVGIFSPAFNLAPLLFSGDRKLVISPRGMLHPGALSKKSSKKKLFLPLFRFLARKQNCMFHVSDEAESDFVKNVIGSGVSVMPLANLPGRIQCSRRPSKSEGRLNILTVAIISPMKNHLAVLECLSRIKSEITYDIIGPVKDEAYWSECRKVMERLPSNISVRYHGAVPPGNLESYYCNAHVFICPSESENFGHALYEAFTAGCPVITSVNTPWNGLREAHAGLNVAVDAHELSEAVAFFSGMKEEELAFWSRSASEFADRALDLQAIKLGYEKLFSVSAR